MAWDNWLMSRKARVLMLLSPVFAVKNSYHKIDELDWIQLGCFRPAIHFGAVLAESEAWLLICFYVDLEIIVCAHCEFVTLNTISSVTLSSHNNLSFYLHLNWVRLLFRLGNRNSKSKLLIVFISQNRVRDHKRIVRPKEIDLWG